MLDWPIINFQNRTLKLFIRNTFYGGKLKKEIFLRDHIWAVLPYWPKFRISPDIWFRTPTEILEASGTIFCPKTPDISFGPKRVQKRPKLVLKWTKMAEIWLLSKAKVFWIFLSKKFLFFLTFFPKIVT